MIEPQKEFMLVAIEEAMEAREVASKGNPRIEIIGPFMREECLKLFHS